MTEQSSSAALKELDEQLRCVCLDLYTKPKTLTCLHSFCLKCIEELPKQKVNTYKHTLITQHTGTHRDTNPLSICNNIAFFLINRELSISLPVANPHSSLKQESPTFLLLF